MKTRKLMGTLLGISLIALACVGCGSHDKPNAMQTEAQKVASFVKQAKDQACGKDGDCSELAQSKMACVRIFLTKNAPYMCCSWSGHIACQPLS